MATDLGTLRAELAALRDEVRDALAFEAGGLRAELDAKADRSTSYPRLSKIISSFELQRFGKQFSPPYLFWKTDENTYCGKFCQI